MGKIQIIRNNNCTLVINNLEHTETLNEHIVDVIAARRFDGLAYVSVIRKKKAVQLECSIQNLIPLNERTKEEQKKIATMGGIASGKSRAARKTLKEELLLLLENEDIQKKISLALEYLAANH